jgi:hypothetical protein
MTAAPAKPLSVESTRCSPATCPQRPRAVDARQRGRGAVAERHDQLRGEDADLGVARAVGDGDRAQRPLDLAHRVARPGQPAAELKQQPAHLAPIRAHRRRARRDH